MSCKPPLDSLKTCPGRAAEYRPPAAVATADAKLKPPVMMHLSCLLALWGTRVGARPRACREPGLLTCVRASGVVGVGRAAGWLPLITFPPCLLARGCLALFLCRLLLILCGSLPQSFLLRRPLRRLFSLPSARPPIRLPHPSRACDVTFVPFPPMVCFVYFQKII